MGDESADLRSIRSDPNISRRDPTSACPGCLDLDYYLFSITWSDYLPNFEAEESPSASVEDDLRYGREVWYHTTMKEIDVSGRGGCKICCVLRQGITHFWDEALEGEEEWESEPCDPPLKRKIRLAIRPGRTLHVSRIKERENEMFVGYTELEFYTEPGCVPIHSAFGHAKPVPSYLSLARCVELIDGWLQACTSQHDACHDISPKLPKRLVFVAEDVVRLVETAGMDYTKYMTLSHCWGDAADMIKTSKENLEQRKLGIEWDELPRLFRDVISIVRKLDCQWIWIDSLCIIQDSRSDWEQESTNMADVYSNTFLNIATAFAPTSDQSCFFDRTTPGDDFDERREKRQNWQVSSKYIKGDDRENSTGVSVRVSLALGHLHIFGGSYVRSRHEVAPLLGRAWVLQERLLAPRTIYICRSELIWECKSSMKCECRYGGEQVETLRFEVARLFQGKLSDQEALDLWLNIVAEYSSLRLTKHSDCLYALAGIASRVSQFVKSEYLAGIWVVDLPRALLWQCASSHSTQSWKRISAEEPTWSWAFLRDDVRKSVNLENIYDNSFGSFTQDDRVLIHHGNSFYGRKHAGSKYIGQLDITGPTVCGKLFYDPKNTADVASSHWVLEIAEDTAAVAQVDCPSEENVAEAVGVTFLLLGEVLLFGSETRGPFIIGIILREVDDLSDKCTRYRRIGITSFFREARGLDSANEERFLFV